MLTTYRYPKFPYRPSPSRPRGSRPPPRRRDRRRAVGLTAALDWRAWPRGRPSRRHDTVSVGSRAICSAKRPLEIWDRLGVAEPMVARGVRLAVQDFFRDRAPIRFRPPAGSGPQVAGDDQPPTVLPGGISGRCLRQANRHRPALEAQGGGAEAGRRPCHAEGRDPRRHVPDRSRLGDRLRRANWTPGGWSVPISPASSFTTGSSSPMW